MNITTVTNLHQFVEARDGAVLTNSRRVAEAFGKQHHHVMQKLDALECSDQFLTSNFSRVKFEHRGNTYEACEMTKDGFMFLVMGFTGKKAAAIKEGYISAFNWMAEQLGLSSKSLVAKAVTEALGAEGARTLSNVMRCRVAKLDAEHQRSAAAKLASALHARFDVPRMELIPADQLDVACNFVAAYAIEGEYLERENTTLNTLTDKELYDVFFLMHHFLAVKRIYDSYQLDAALRMLRSGAGIEMLDHFRDSMMAVSTLQKRLPDMEAAAVRIGHRPGTVMGRAAA